MSKWYRRTRELAGVSFIASQKSAPHDDIKCSPCVSRLNPKRTHRKRGDKSGHRRPLEKEISPRTEFSNKRLTFPASLFRGRIVNLPGPSGTFCRRFSYLPALQTDHSHRLKRPSNFLSPSTFSTAPTSATAFASSITMAAALICESSEKIRDLLQDASPIELLKTRLYHRGPGSDR